MKRSGFARGRVERRGAAKNISPCQALRDDVPLTLIVFHLKAGKVIAEYLRVCIVAISIRTPPDKVTTPSAPILLLRYIASLCWLSLKVIFIIAVNLLFQSVDPFIYC